MTTGEDDAEMAGRRSTGVELHMLDGLGAEVDWQDEISVWLDELSDQELDRILR